MIRAYLKAIFILCAAYQITECMVAPRGLKGQIAAGLVSTITTGCIAYGTRDNSNTGLYMLVYSGALAALQSNIVSQKMPNSIQRDIIIYGNYLFYFSAACFIAGLGVLTYQNKFIFLRSCHGL